METRKKTGRKIVDVAVRGCSLVATVLALAHPSRPLQVVMTLVGVFVVVKHRSNLVRLVKGCENKIY